MPSFSAKKILQFAHKNKYWWYTALYVDKHTFYLLIKKRLVSQFEI